MFHREEVFLAKKLNKDNLSYDNVLSSTEESLERLGADYIELFYVHWPVEDYVSEETLPMFDELRDSRVIDHVGVSNFTVESLGEAMEVLDAPIIANQVERHPLLPPRDELVEARIEE